MAAAAAGGGGGGPPLDGPPSAYEPYLEVALSAAREAGAIIAAAWDQKKTVDTKAGALFREAHLCSYSVASPPPHGSLPTPLPSCLTPPPTHTGEADLVTETDKRCEELILQRITAAFPGHKFIGEEGSAEQVGAAGWCCRTVFQQIAFVIRCALPCSRAC